MTSSKKFRKWHKTNTLFKNVANENSNNNSSHLKWKAWSRDFDLFLIKRFSFPVMRSPAIVCLLVVLDTSGSHNLSNQYLTEIIKFSSIHFLVGHFRDWETSHYTLQLLSLSIFLYLRIGFHHWLSRESPDNIHKRISLESCYKSVRILHCQLNIRWYLKSKFSDRMSFFFLMWTDIEKREIEVFFLDTDLLLFSHKKIINFSKIWKLKIPRDYY